MTYGGSLVMASGARSQLAPAVHYACVSDAAGNTCVRSLSALVLPASCSALPLLQHACLALFRIWSSAVLPDWSLLTRWLAFQSGLHGGVGCHGAPVLHCSARDGGAALQTRLAPYVVSLACSQGSQPQLLPLCRVSDLRLHLGIVQLVSSYHQAHVLLT